MTKFSKFLYLMNASNSLGGMLYLRQLRLTAKGKGQQMEMLTVREILDCTRLERWHIEKLKARGEFPQAVYKNHKGELLYPIQPLIALFDRLNTQKGLAL